jgi:hypothetical protein
MYVKLKDNFINLDTIKKVTEIRAYAVNRVEYENNNILYYFELTDPKMEARWLDITVNGTTEQKKDIVIYGFETHYIGEKYPEKIITGTSRLEARKYLEAFIAYLNNNQTTIHEIKI